MALMSMCKVMDELDKVPINISRERERERMRMNFFKAEIPRNGHKKNHRLRNEIRRYQQ